MESTMDGAGPMVPALQLAEDVRKLCSLGPRADDVVLQSALAWISSRLAEEGLEGRLEPVPTPVGRDWTSRHNLICRIGTGTKVLAFCAHYDTVPGTLGADDNASGIAALLRLASIFRSREPKMPAGMAVEFAFLVNEEPPYCGTEHMGSFHYFMKSLPQRGEPALVVNLDCLGYSPNGDDPAWIIRSKADRTSEQLFAAWPAGIPLRTNLHEDSGLGSLSDLRWVIGRCPAVHLSDMAIETNPHMHRQSDRPSTLDYDWMAEVLEGLYGVIEHGFHTGILGDKCTSSQSIGTE